MGVTRAAGPRKPAEPVPYFIKNKDSESPVVRFRCPKCGTTFDYGSSERYCHHCGKKLDWSFAVEKIKPDTWRRIVALCDGDTIKAEYQYLQFIQSMEYRLSLSTANK